MKFKSIDVELMRSLLDYRPDLGGSCLVWKVDMMSGKKGNIVKAKAGSLAGHMAPDGYGYIRVHKHLYKAHRLVWAITKGEDPPYQIDHIHGVEAGNCIENLRLAPNGQRDNMQNRVRNKNNPSGFVGVSKASKGKGWIARIGVDKKIKYLGTFSTPEEAHAAYLKAKKQMHSFEFETKRFENDHTN